MKRVRVMVVGDVQHVGFRAWVKHKAEFLGLGGWVKNTKDGNVEAVFEGEEPVVKEMIDECLKGPPASYVERVEEKDEKPIGEKSFRIVL